MFFLYFCSLKSHPHQTDRIQLGVAFDILENLETISIGNSIFTLPNNLKELQDSLGGVGECVQVGYSNINLGDAGEYYIIIILIPESLN